jgi:hypothetical protein
VQACAAVFFSYFAAFTTASVVVACKLPPPDQSDRAFEEWKARAPLEHAGRLELFRSMLESGPGRSQDARRSGWRGALRFGNLFGIGAGLHLPGHRGGRSRGAPRPFPLESAEVRDERR